MKVTDEMVEAALTAWKETNVIFGDLHALMRAALEAALSHAAGQDGEQCRAASVLTADMAKALPNGTMDDSTFQAVEDALDAIEAPITGPDGRWLTLPQRIRAFSRGVPEGK